ncbi:phosphatidylinositol synthase [Xylona heveae TC161]|uniref:Phosphatidylinositol synthase n=1 Tax=Xylona heveae (strain CBS 132557 / TC161) TaxID=1328760 RepID=A0A165FDL6_XYLHT|nr:phosphatidylinositol synthase [Xylona heveae TC161]KZF20859.1 phosphatidylinositol synthase [Xylona heveae TC161]
MAELQNAGNSRQQINSDSLGHHRWTTTSTSENIFLFVPNLIGYGRVLSVVTSLYFMPLHPRTCILFYGLSCILDAFDGAAARRFDQSTQFGAVLDMIIDRCTTSCLLVFLASVFPAWSMVFQCLISLDLASHYAHMYATLAMGTTGQSHKEIDENRPKVLRIYYSNPKVLFTVCAFNELFFIALYLLSFSFQSPTLDGNLLFRQANDMETATYKNTPTSSRDSIAPWSAAAMEVARANKVDSTGPWILLALSTVFMVFKQYVNVIQLIEATKWLATGDLNSRKKARLSRNQKLD